MCIPQFITFTVLDYNIIAIAVVMLIVYFVTTHSRNKREKQLRKETADRLAEYRRSKQDDESVGTGALRFVNETDHDDAAIKTFANYQAYHLQIFMPVFTVILSVIAIAIMKDTARRFAQNETVEVTANDFDRE